MQSLTNGSQQVATWATGDILMYCGAIAIVIAFFAAMGGRGMALGLFATAVVCVAGASASMGIARQVYNWFHMAALDGPHPVYAMQAAPVRPLLTPAEAARVAFRA